MMYGMKRTTIYLPHEMKRAVEQEAARRGATEAEIIRTAVAKDLQASRRPRPVVPVFPEGLGEEIASRVDDLMERLDGDR